MVGANYLVYVLPGSFVALLIGIGIKVSKHPTFKDLSKKEHFIRKDLQRKDVCEQIHKSVDEKLNIIPEMQKVIMKIALKVGVKDD